MSPRRRVDDQWWAKMKGRRRKEKSVGEVKMGQRDSGRWHRDEGLDGRKEKGLRNVPIARVVQ
jgi:hypothetical protein